MKTVRWGIVGPGRIAQKFATDLAVVEGARLQAVAGRSLERAREFGARFGCDTAYDSPEQLATDEHVDAVYVATPHPFHLDGARASLAAGKAVLCEKPLTGNADQAHEMVELARSSGTFLMEAMWTRFLPIMDVVREWIDEGAVGRVRLVRAAFGFALPAGTMRPRLSEPALGGGSLLDVGVYPLAFARWVYGAAAEQTRAVGGLGESGVDEICSMVQRFPGGGLAELSSAVAVDTDRSALIAGSEGKIEIPRFWSAQEATLVRGDERLTVSRPFESGGFEYQIRAVGRCLAAGELECSAMTLGESLESMQLLDGIRRQIGVEYPFD